MGTLTGKTALVTGASRGIGRAIALRLAAEGARVAVHCATDRKAATEAVEEIIQTGGHAFTVCAEFGTPGDVESLFAGLKVGFGDEPLDILVNNAAIGGQSGSIERTTLEAFDHIFAVNVRAPFFIIQRALPLMRDGGRIINISSADTRIAIPGELAYSMSKGAINTLSRTLANKTGARRITVNAVAPGITDTGKLAVLHQNTELAKITKAVTALGRFGHPDDVAKAVAFLASDEAGWITGQVLDASGGLFLGPPDLAGQHNSNTEVDDSRSSK